MTLTRKINPMPADIAAQLEETGLSGAFDARPPYQRNDYLGWIGRARRTETRTRRIAQMLAELESGNTYMKMAWLPGKPSRNTDNSAPGNQ